MISLPDRILNNCEPIPESGCLVWLGKIERGGYGVAWWNGRQRLLHRVSYEVSKGSIPHGASLDHLCRVRCCINPEHLEPVSIKVNILLGQGIAALNSRKTHCRNGHPFSEDNTYIYPSGDRSCRICGRNAFNAWYKRKRELPL